MCIGLVELKDHRTLSDYNIQYHDVVTLVRLPSRVNVDFIRVDTGNSFDFNPLLRGSDTIGYVKAQISTKEGWDTVVVQKVFGNSLELVEDDSLTLHDLGCTPLDLVTFFYSRSRFGVFLG